MTQGNRTIVALYQRVILDDEHIDDGKAVAATRISMTASPWPHAAHLRLIRTRTHARTHPVCLYAHAGQSCLAYFRYHMSSRSWKRARSITRIVAAAET